MDTQRITEDLLKKREQLSALEGEIAGLQVDIKTRQAAFSEAFLEAGSRNSTPAFEARERQLANAEGALQRREKIAEGLRQGIRDLESQAALARLFEMHGGAFHANLEKSQRAIDAIRDIVEKLNRDVAELNQATGEILSGSETAIGAFSAITGHLSEDLSLSEFLKGNIVKTDDRDRESVTEQTGRNIQALARGLEFNVDARGLERLLERVQMLQSWRVKVLSFSDPIALMKNRQSLVGKPATKTKPGVSEFSPPPYDFILRNRDKYSEGDVQKAETALLAGAKRFKDESFARFYSERA